MKTYRFAVYFLIVSLVSFGCDSSDSKDNSTAVSPTSPNAFAEAKEASPNNPSSGAMVEGQTTTPPQQVSPSPLPPQPKETPPTEEQIARWTPPPFDPLQLLAIEEWKKTSFSYRLAALSDGQHYIVVGSRVLLWPIAADEPSHVFQDVDINGNRQFTSVAVAPNGKWFAAGDSSGMLRIWSLEDQTEIASKQLYQSGIQHIAVVPDSSQIATITYDDEVSIWDADSLELKSKFPVNTNGVKRIEYVGPDLLAVVGETMSLWTVNNGTKTQDIPTGRYCMAFGRTSDGARLIFGTGSSLNTWDIVEGKPGATVVQGVNGNSILSVASDNKTLATSDGHSIDVWSLADGRHMQSIHGFGSNVVDISWLPKTNLLVAASDTGITRIWGTNTQAEAVGLEPIPTSNIKSIAGTKEPASPEQLEQMINWSSFPTLAGSESVIATSSDLSCLAPVSIAEARSFYRYFLTKNNWTELAPDPNNPPLLKFQKDGSEISGYFYDNGNGKTNISFHTPGNYDVRWLPKVDGKTNEIVYENFETSIYRVKASLLQIETTLLRELHEAGWTPYSRLNSSSSADPEARDLLFLRNGTTLRISVNKSQDAADGTFTIQQSLSANDSWAPVPPDAGFVEFDGSTDPKLIAISKLSLPEVSKFYDQALTSYGWIAQSIGRSVKEEHSWQPYIRGQCDFGVSLTKLPDGRTLVRIGNAKGSLWEASQREDEGEPAPAVGLQAADFPLLNSTKAGKLDTIQKTIEVKIDNSTLASVADAYSKALGELGWEAAQGGIRDETYTFFDFSKDGKTITLRARKQEDAAVVQFEGDGLLWTKQPTGPSKVVSYENWLRANKLPPSLEMLDQYENEMKGINAE